MTTSNPVTSLSEPARLPVFLMNLPWGAVVEWILPFLQRIAEKMIPGGVYEVLDYESTLELSDAGGRRAVFHKRKKIRYLQDDVIAYQDFAWGDGEILLGYRCNKGKPVDRYRYGYKTYVLISLREVRNRGDVDEFNIQWNIRRGFLKKDGFWGTDVSQRMRHLKINVIFPRLRPPLRISLEESNRRRTLTLTQDAQHILPDGRRLVTWETVKPRLHELYVLRWMW